MGVFVFCYVDVVGVGYWLYDGIDFVGVVYFGVVG